MLQWIRALEAIAVSNFLGGSLRTRILLFAVITCLLLACGAASLIAFLRNTQSAQLRQSEQHLAAIAEVLAHSYAEDPARIASLADAAVGPPPGPPPRPPADGEPPMPPPPPDDSFSPVTARLLQNEPGIEGGLYAAGSGALVGYAFPTHEGPGPRKEMPLRERPTIESLVRSTVSSASPRHLRFEGAHDAVLFASSPIREPGASRRIVGAAWLMERLPGVDAGRNRQLLWVTLGFGSAALLTGLLALLVIAEMRAGVGAVLGRLGMLGTSFDPALSDEDSAGRKPAHLAEFERVLEGIDMLALSLRQKVSEQRALEAQVRHGERLAALGQFAAGIAHELRNPLATIRLRTQMTQRGGDRATTDRNTTVVLDEIDRLDAIIQKLLYFARPVDLRRHEVDVSALCAETVANWNEREPGLIFVFEQASTILCKADKPQIRQVLDNLVENAAHATRAAGARRITVSVTRFESEAEIAVVDEGIGVDPRVQQKIFDPFFTTRENGTGLGLSISYEIVQAHGGELRVTPGPHGGTRATFTLPLALSIASYAGRGEADG